MSPAKFSTYLPDSTKWTRYVTQNSNTYQAFYTLPGSTIQPGEQLSMLKLISPTEQVLEQAKSTLDAQNNMGCCKQRQETTCKRRRAPQKKRNEKNKPVKKSVKKRKFSK